MKHDSHAPNCPLVCCTRADDPAVTGVPGLQDRIAELIRESEYTEADDDGDLVICRDDVALLAERIAHVVEANDQQQAATPPYIAPDWSVEQRYEAARVWRAQADEIGLNDPARADLLNSWADKVLKDCEHLNCWHTIAEDGTFTWECVACGLTWEVPNG